MHLPGNQHAGKRTSRLEDGLFNRFVCDARIRIAGQTDEVDPELGCTSERLRRRTSTFRHD